MHSLLSAIILSRSWKPLIGRPSAIPRHPPPTAQRQRNSIEPIVPSSHYHLHWAHSRAFFFIAVGLKEREGERNSASFGGHFARNTRGANERALFESVLNRVARPIFSPCVSKLNCQGKSGFGTGWMMISDTTFRALKH